MFLNRKLSAKPFQQPNLCEWSNINDVNTIYVLLLLFAEQTFSFFSQTCMNGEKCVDFLWWSVNPIQNTLGGSVCLFHGNQLHVFTAIKTPPDCVTMIFSRREGSRGNTSISMKQMQIHKHTPTHTKNAAANQQEGYSWLSPLWAYLLSHVCLKLQHISLWTCSIDFSSKRNVMIRLSCKEATSDV